METVLLPVVEADDHKNQRSVNYFSTFFTKKKNVLQVTDANIIFQWLSWNTGTQTVRIFFFLT